MQRPQMRPQFRCELATSGSRLLQVIQSRLEVPSSPVVGHVLRRHVELTVRNSCRQVWSPHLSIDLLREDDALVLRGRYGPNPALWMLLVALYGVLVVGALASVVLGFSQWTLGWTPWGFWGFPGCVALGTGLWWISLLGQRVTVGQMEELATFLHECMRRAETDLTSMRH